MPGRSFRAMRCKHVCPFSKQSSGGCARGRGGRKNQARGCSFA
jgi:hypothetical protein